MSMTATTIVSLPELPPVRRGGYGAETNVSRFNRPRVFLQCYSYDSKRDLQKTTHSGALKCTHVLYNTRSSHARAATVICAGAMYVYIYGEKIELKERTDGISSKPTSTAAHALRFEILSYLQRSASFFR